ncbi:MAG: methyltransferase type 12 [Chloracidobacterium sp. CP2_5A]|nr:MAG: methyltransferase type 12 [Chloracidobacterium sp. CP2_5A]
MALSGARAGCYSRRMRAYLKAVLWAYRLILGREPTEEEVQAHLGYPKLSDLRRAFFSCPEFRQRERYLCGPSLTGFEPALLIEDAVEDATLEKLLELTRLSWEHLGEHEPHWSVLSADEFKQANLDAHRERFYASGQHSAEQFLNLLRRNGCLPEKLSDKRIIEYGCGVGRVTHALAQRFGEVRAYDISAPHLELARQFAASLGLDNIRFAQIKRPQDVTQLPQADAVYTTIVLQHNPPPVIRFILKALLDALAPSGVACFQLLTYQQGYAFSAEAYLRASPEQGRRVVEMHVLPQRRVFEIIAQSGCRVLETLDDALADYRGGDLSNTFLVQKQPAPD